MQVISDLHIHSKYSRATSKNMDLSGIAAGAKTKGIDIIGTGDFTHPVWMRGLKKNLAEETSGIYSFNDVSFILTSEISLMYKSGDRGRRVHFLIMAPSIAIAEQINEFLDTKGRRDYDGRPIFGFTSIELADVMMQISKDIEIIPAHAWTPYFGIFGSKSGFDSIEECFEDKSKHIHAIETGLSSDPAMNWRIPGLDEITLISNSDAHSPAKIGREANVFELKENFSYKDIINIIRTRKNFLFTIEVDPGFGKYHFDGHMDCKISMSPNETKKLNGICPKCKKPLTIGVMSRVEELARRKEGFMPKNAVPFKLLLPLPDLISFAMNCSAGTKKVGQEYGMLIHEFGSEFNVLMNADKKNIEKISGDKITDIILSNREGGLKIKPGYDGFYGKIIN